MYSLVGRYGAYATAFTNAILTWREINNLIKIKMTILPVATVVSSIIMYLQVFKCIDLAFQSYFSLRYCFR